MPIPVPGRVAEALRRSTVEVRSGGRRWQGNGSGVALARDQVITNAHVIHEGSLTLVSYEGATVSGSIVKIDRRRDLALLAGPGLGAAPASLRDSDELRVGMPIIAVGNPLGFVGAVSTGIVHAIGPAGPISGQTWIQADLRLAPGNSGGPLADLQGRIVGINTMIVAGGLALAIPSRAVQSFLNRTISPRSLGVVVRPVQVKDRSIGMMILELVPGGSAERASLLPGDILVGSNGKQLRFVDDLENAIDEAPGALLRLDFYRAGQEKLRKVAVRLLPESQIQTSSAA
ncbi:MAG: trypsin-like peptidase domain-containing protein [Acidobacteriaceae bacterium]|nr:trypsin-like peptidase domain-containing protein [Acidobacteriaceae bacterium]MBV9781348.1 trypsin-like peptidase domain-containing protein [Acidobacteriaceae bacterium]